MAVFDVAEENFTLVPLDTGGTPEGAAEAARAAARQQAKLVLGPLLSSSVRSAAIATRGSDPNIVPFSRSEKRRVGKECVSTCNSRGPPYPLTKTTDTTPQ